MDINRAESIARARKSIRKGVSASKWIANMRSKGLSYNKTEMLADYRNVLHLETKKDTLKYVRKDRYPTEKHIAAVTWAISKEYMYVVQVKTQSRPDEPVLTHDINIQSDVPLTPGMIEQRVIEGRLKEEKYAGELLLEIKPWTAVRRVLE